MCFVYTCAIRVKLKLAPNMFAYADDKLMSCVKIAKLAHTHAYSNNNIITIIMCHRHHNYKSE